MMLECPFGHLSAFQSVRQMVARGEVSTVNIGRAVRIERLEIERFEAGRHHADRDLIRAQ